MLKIHTIAGVSVNGLEETEGDPAVHGHNVEVAAESAVEDGTSEGTGSENKDLSRMSVLGSETERSRVLVVDLMNVLVKRTPVEGTVSYMIRCISQ